MEIVNLRIQSYVGELSEPSDPILAEMEGLAEKKSFPIVGPQVGRLLGILTRFAAARRVLELGSGFGYSALWFARSLPPGGVVHCTDLSIENRDLALKFFGRAGLSERVVFHVGDALQIARGQKGVFDVVFNDIDKQAYPESVETALALLRTGGLFITDNALWGGRVADGEADETTRAVMRFNEIVCRHSGLETIILPVRDGLAVCQKK